MTEENFSWINFYSEFADRLVPFADNREELLKKLQEAYQSIGMKLSRLDNSGIPKDIDPFTVFGLFNKQINIRKRFKIVKGLKNTFKVNAAIPQDFNGLPVFNNLNATLYAFTNDPKRGKNDINNLWDTFLKALAYSENANRKNENAFAKSYGISSTQAQVGWKLTKSLYWIRPNTFVSLDSINRWFIGNQNSLDKELSEIFPHENAYKLTDGKRYLHICNAVHNYISQPTAQYHSIPEISMAAYTEAERVNKELKKQAKATDGLGESDVDTVNYWVFSAGENGSNWDEFYSQNKMALGWPKLGNLANFKSKSAIQQSLKENYDNGTQQTNNAKTLWDFSQNIKAGDIIFVKSGRSKIIGRGAVTGEYAFIDDNTSRPHVREVKWTDKGEWPLEIKLPTKTLTNITDLTETLSAINELFEEGVDTTENNNSNFPQYNDENFLEEVFISPEEYQKISTLLKVKKNIIIQGAPGVGKTYIAKRLAYSLMGEKNPSRVQMIQFHQSYSYEDFIEGFRPTETGFELTKGIFYNFCKLAQDDEEHEYYFIIDEINRGNLSKIFGELFMLMENDKRGSKNKVQLLYSKELFYVPSNVYIIGLMNTADRSLALLDYALRRRFGFYTLAPAFESDRFQEYISNLDFDKLTLLISCIQNLNQEITSDDSLGKGFLIGHSYFSNFNANTINGPLLTQIIDFELIPLLNEYWFDEPDKIEEWSLKLKNCLE